MEIYLEDMSDTELEEFFLRPLHLPETAYPLIIHGAHRKVTLQTSEEVEIWRQGYIMGKITTLIAIVNEPWEDVEPKKSDDDGEIN